MARGLLGGARVKVRHALQTGNAAFALQGQRDVDRAIRLLSLATNMNVPFFDRMSAAVDQAIGAAVSIQRAGRVLRFVDNSVAFTMASRSLMQADASLGRALRSAMAGTHP